MRANFGVEKNAMFVEPFALGFLSNSEPESAGEILVENDWGSPIDAGYLKQNIGIGDLIWPNGPE
jgi:hypothetical protein